MVTIKHRTSRRVGLPRRLSILCLLIILLLPCLTLRASAASGIPKEVYPGGMTFGIRFSGMGVTVADFFDIRTENEAHSPGKSAGLREGDRIVRCDDVSITSVADFTAVMDRSCGKAITVTAVRGRETVQLSLVPVKDKTDGKYKSGIRVRDGGAGIGTVTFICPDKNTFAGLGHGICDEKYGTLVPMTRGTIYSVSIERVEEGKPGAPGELKGFFTAEKIGTLLENTDVGMFGALTALPQQIKSSRLTRTPIAVGKRSDVHDGKAKIYSTLSERGIDEYEVEISNIHPEATGGKCFTVHVTDKRLIAESGGIVQGMSGSPIIQDGKLIGAVTHVMINDPTTGYGIFIENMMNAAPTRMAA